MLLYNYLRSKGYEMLDFYDGDDWETLLEINGEPRAPNWKPLRVRRIRVNRREGFRQSDSPYYGSHTLVFRRAAIDALRDILEAHGELLPLEDDEGVELFAYNPRALEALDVVQSKGWRNDDGSLDVVQRHVFFPSVVEGVDIFRQVADRGSDIYLSDRFVQRWKQAKLKGLDFILAWDSDLPPEQQPNVWTSKPIK